MPARRYVRFAEDLCRVLGWFAVAMICASISLVVQMVVYCYAFGVPGSPIQTVAEVFADAHAKAGEMFVRLEHPTAGETTVTGVPVKLSETPGAVTVSPPALGQHSGEVLPRLGYSEEEVAGPKDKRVI